MNTAAFSKNHLKNLFLSLILTSLYFKSISCSLVLFKLKTLNQNANSSYDYPSYLWSSSFYTDFKIGTPQNTIKMVIDTEHAGLSISEDAYDYSKSQNYKLLVEHGSYPWEEINHGNASSDDMYINTISENEKKINGKFISISKNLERKNCMGLKIPNVNEHNIESIFNNLNKSKIINTFKWCAIFPKDNSKNLLENAEGEIVIGGLCEDYKKNIFTQNKFLTRMDFTNIYKNYALKPNRAYLGTNPLKNTLFYNTLRFSLKHINRGTIELESSYRLIFFKKWLDNNVCFYKQLNAFSEFYYIYCDKSKKANDNSQFKLEEIPQLSFDVEDYNKTFVLDYNDLFIQSKDDPNIVFFSFIFPDRQSFYDDEDYKNIVVGIHFLQKYQLGFDPDNMEVAFYEQSNENKNKENNFNIILIASGVVVGAILLFISGVLFHKFFSKIQKKNRANELDDDFVYETENNEKGV